MKILFLNWRDRKNPRSGGAEVVAEEIAKRLAAKGHRITLFCASFNGCKSEEVIDGYQVIRKGREWTVHFWAFVFYFKKFRKENFDLVIDQIHGIPFFTPLYVRKPKKIAFIHEVAKEIWLKMYSFPIGQIGYFIEPLFYKFYKKTPFITVSKSTKKDLLSVKISEKHISIIPEAITVQPLKELPEKEKDPTTIFVGRVCRMKGVEDLIKAHLIAKQQIPDLKLWIIGSWDEKYKKKLDNLCHSERSEESRSNNNSITFFNYTPEEKKNELLSRAWLLCSASLKEGFGLVTVEAAAMGAPSVVYNVDGFRDSVLNNKTGILCQKNTPENLAENIVHLIENKELYKNLQTNALKYSRQFNFDKTTEVFENIIKKHA